MATSEDLVWYVSYGSNMNEDRLLDYLRGGTGLSGVATIGFEDAAPPLRTSRGRIPNRLYFKGHYPSAWGGTSGAFVATQSGHTAGTFTVEYLISWKQFIALVAEENRTANTPASMIATALEQAKQHLTAEVDGNENNAFLIDDALTYGAVIPLGRVDQYPRLTVTASKPPPRYVAPSASYLEVIVRGLRLSRPELTDSEVLDYFADVQGVGRSWPAEPSADADGNERQLKESARAWANLNQAVTRTSEPRISVAIVGGGIAGLFCADRLAQEYGFEITVFEASPRFGGRIETPKMGGFNAEFGPMRFEPTIQPMLDEMVTKRFHLAYESFPSPAVDTATARTGSSRYFLRPDELRHVKDKVGAKDPEPDPLVTTPLNLLRLGVLRMFREAVHADLKTLGLDATALKDIGAAWQLDLCLDTTLPPPEGNWRNRNAPAWDWEAKDGAWDVVTAGSATPSVSALEVRTFRCLIQQWLDTLDDVAYDSLRRNARHRSPREQEEGTNAHLLSDDGFWNAMGEELSPAAISYIRDEGTFYHLFPDNPSAVEWGIFWLRLLKSDANQLKTITSGTESLVTALVTALRAHTHVTLRLAQEVLEVEPGSGAGPLKLTVHDRRDGRQYSVETNHCVLALPLAPLQRLSSHFPSQIREDLGQAFGFGLLKCVLVVRRPWWRKEIPPQSGAGGVPTRELHFKRDGDTGLVMLYTDLPANQFWRRFVTSPIHARAEIDAENEDFKRSLVRHLLINARREAHRDLASLLLDEIGASGDLTWQHEDIQAHLSEFVRRLETDVITESKVTILLKEWYAELISQPPEVFTLTHLERLLDVLRHPGWAKMTGPCDEIRPKVHRVLSIAAPSPVGGVDLVNTAIGVVFFETDQRGPDGNFQSGPELPIDKQIDKLCKTDLVTWGIRDWARPPVGAGCHAWSPGARSWEIVGRLDAFTLVGRLPGQPERNVHICGEAISDYQGFIEGALRSADRVKNAIVVSTAAQKRLRSSSG